MRLYGTGYPCGQFKSAVPSQHHAHPSLLTVRAEWEKRIPDTVQALLGDSQSAGVLSTLLLTEPKHSTVQAAVEKGNSAPARLSTAGQSKTP